MSGSKYNDSYSLLELIYKLEGMDRDQVMRVYYDPLTWRFYLLFDGTLGMMIPQGCHLISSGRRVAFYSAVCAILSKYQPPAELF